MKRRDLSVISADVYLAGVKWQKSTDQKGLCPFTGFPADKCKVCIALFPKIELPNHPGFSTCPCDAYPLSYVRRVIKELGNKVKSQSQMPSWAV